METPCRDLRCKPYRRSAGHEVSNQDHSMPRWGAYQFRFQFPAQEHQKKFKLLMIALSSSAPPSCSDDNVRMGRKTKPIPDTSQESPMLLTLYISGCPIRFNLTAWEERGMFSQCQLPPCLGVPWCCSACPDGFFPGASEHGRGWMTPAQNLRFSSTRMLHVLRC